MPQTRNIDIHAYEYNASMVISSDNQICDNSSIIALKDGAIRSICEILDYSEIFGRKYYTLMIYSNETFEEHFQLFYQESESSKLQPLDYSFDFIADMSCGDYICPVILELTGKESGNLTEIINSLSVYPNPFNPTTNILYELEKTAEVKLEIFNIKGQKIETLLNSTLQPGKHSLFWDASTYNSGIYLLHFQSDKKHLTKKLILLK
jgi:hypothetical protein